MVQILGPVIGSAGGGLGCTSPASPATVNRLGTAACEDARNARCEPRFSLLLILQCRVPDTRNQPDHGGIVRLG